MRKKHPKGKEYDTFTNLELMLMVIISNPNYSQKDFDFFKTKIGSDYVDQSNLYRLSVQQNQSDLTKLILDCGKFDINDGELIYDILFAIRFYDDERIQQHLQNGYIPSEEDLKSIIRVFEEENRQDDDMCNYFKCQ